MTLFEFTYAWLSVLLVRLLRFRDHYDVCNYGSARCQVLRH